MLVGLANGLKMRSGPDGDVSPLFFVRSVLRPMSLKTAASRGVEQAILRGPRRGSDSLALIAMDSWKRHHRVHEKTESVVVGGSLRWPDDGPSAAGAGC